MSNPVYVLPIFGEWRTLDNTNSADVEIVINELWRLAEFGGVLQFEVAPLTRFFGFGDGKDIIGAMTFTENQSYWQAVEYLLLLTLVAAGEELPMEAS